MDVGRKVFAIKILSMASEEDHTQFSSFMSAVYKGQACYSFFLFFFLLSQTLLCCSQHFDKKVRYQGSNATYK